MAFPLLAAVPALLGSLGGAGAAAGAAGATTAATTAAGVTGAAGAGAAGAGGIGGALGGAGGAGGGGGLMSMIGGGGGAGGSGGGMKMAGQVMNMMPQPHKNNEAEKMMMARNGGKTFKYQFGGAAGFFDPATMDWLKTQTGGGAGGGAENAMAIPDMAAPIAAAENSTAPAPGAGMAAVQNPPPSPLAQASQPMPGQAAMPTNPNAPSAGINDPAAGTDINTGPVEQNNSSQSGGPAQSSGKAMDPMGSAMSVISGQKDGNEYAKDAEGYTAVTETSDIIGGASENFKKGDVIGGTMELVGGVVGAASQQRKRTRELQIAEGMQDRAQQNQSEYSDPNSVYYSAKDGAPINKGMMKKNLMQMGGALKGILPFQDGGKPNQGNLTTTIKGEEEGQVDNRPGYVQRGRSHKYSPNSYMGDMGTDKKTSSYSRNIGDVAYDVFHPNKPARVRMKFQDGGGGQLMQKMERTKPPQHQLMNDFKRVPDYDKSTGRNADLYPNGQPMNPGDAQFMDSAGRSMGSIRPSVYDNQSAEFNMNAGRSMGSITGMMNPVNDIKVRENKRRMVSKGRDAQGNKFKMVTKK